MLNTENLNKRKRAVKNILREGNTITFYSKSGVEQAKERAKVFGTTDKGILFATEDELDVHIKEFTNLTTL